MSMDISTLIILSLIGVTAGIASGYIGIGGGVIIIPALIYFLKLDQKYLKLNLFWVMDHAYCLLAVVELDQTFPHTY